MYEGWHERPNTRDLDTLKFNTWHFVNTLLSMATFFHTNPLSIS